MGGKPISLKQVATAAVFTLSCFCLILFVWIEFGGTVPLAAHGYRFHVDFAQAPNLAVNEQVRIAGVPAGKVVSVKPSAGLTEATLELKREYAPLSSASHVLLRSKTLLGENFVDISPGDRSAPRIPENGWLSYANVGQTQNIDQVLGAFNPPTRAAFKKFFGEVGQALQNHGSDLNAAIGEGNPALTDLDQLITILSAQGTQVRQLINDGGSALHAVASRSTDLQNLIQSGNQLLAATAARNRELTATVDALPPFLAQLRPTLSALQTSANYAAPTLAALVPVAPLVRPALHETSELAPELTRLFHQSGPLITDLQRDVPSLVAIIKAVKPLAVVLDPALRQLVPVVQFFNLYRNDSLATAANTGAALEATTPLPGGGSVHYARVVTPLSPSIIVGQPLVGPNDRHNDYPNPDWQTTLTSGLTALDCNNTHNPPTAIESLPIIGTGTGAPPCKVQAPWSFQGVSREFPHIQPYTP
jgi:ABC-type transporter Mla subunit MlaD